MGMYYPSYSINTFKEPYKIFTEDILPIKCEKCPISKKRMVDFPSYPILRDNRILVVLELPSYDALKYTNEDGENTIAPNFMYGRTWQVLNRVFDYLNLQHHFFSYVPIIRCWRNIDYTIKETDFKICTDYISKFITLSSAPVIISMGSTVTKNLLDRTIINNERNEFKGIINLRNWKEPLIGIHKLPIVPTEHPLMVTIGNCNAQPTFRAICVDFIRAIMLASQYISEYSIIIKKSKKAMEPYLKDYKNDND